MSADVAATPPPVRLATRLAVGAALAGGLSVPVLALALLVEGRYERLERLDLGVAGDLHAWAVQHPAVVDLLKVLEDVLNPNVFRAAAVLAAVGLWRAGARRLAVWALVSTGAGALLGVVLKQVMHRARPVFPDPVSTAGSYSFPSGHALGSFVGVGVLLIVLLPGLERAGRLIAWTVGTGLVLLTGFDRVALGVHYVSDVVAGWFAAAAVLAGTAAAFSAWRGRQPAGGLDPRGSRRFAREVSSTVHDR